MVKAKTKWFLLKTNKNFFAWKIELKKKRIIKLNGSLKSGFCL